MVKFLYLEQHIQGYSVMVRTRCPLYLPAAIGAAAGRMPLPSWLNFNAGDVSANFFRQPPQ
ncbi:hypothetical protein CHU92_15135 [Flavobacterium cyanobacteriorum]|uniref:Uncharacterized protein n=1 Tax=Flavobacterium cyanobacteriorum TaxID=2022802 RepID=A0A255YTI0_9FLAO|nr:hypothetical protein [Flavobacterium cyanobacteriorum]OYQ31974.1 hypothetical protein CHU92_15135 [Flavobacterium cyanobacteriorum]